eukprot:gene8412-18294_t
MGSVPFQDGNAAGVLDGAGWVDRSGGKVGSPCRGATYSVYQRLESNTSRGSGRAVEMGSVPFQDGNAAGWDSASPQMHLEESGQVVPGVTERVLSGVIRKKSSSVRIATKISNDKLNNALKQRGSYDWGLPPLGAGGSPPKRTNSKSEVSQMSGSVTEAGPSSTRSLGHLNGPGGEGRGALDGEGGPRGPWVSADRRGLVGQSAPGLGGTASVPLPAAEGEALGRGGGGEGMEGSGSASRVSLGGGIIGLASHRSWDTTRHSLEIEGGMPAELAQLNRKKSSRSEPGQQTGRGQEPAGDNTREGAEGGPESSLGDKAQSLRECHPGDLAHVGLPRKPLSSRLSVGEIEEQVVGAVGTQAGGGGGGGLQDSSRTGVGASGGGGQEGSRGGGEGGGATGQLPVSSLAASSWEGGPGGS